jgi:hypothetical protein
MLDSAGTANAGDLRVESDRNGRRRGNFLDQVVGHGAGEGGAADQEGYLLCIPREVDSGLAGGVARPDDEHSLPTHRRRLADGSAVEHAGPEESVDPGGSQAAPQRSPGSTNLHAS